MKVHFKWLIRGILITPVFVLLTILMGGGGHGNPLPLILLYPGVLPLHSDNEIYMYSMFLLQYPVYGLILDLAKRYENNNGHIYVLMLIGLHLGATIWSAIIVNLDG